jgi:hypothetical protein
MKTGLFNEPDGIGSALLLEGGDNLLRRIVPSVAYFDRKTNNVKDECGAGRNSSSSSSSGSISNKTACH